MYCLCNASKLFTGIAVPGESRLNAAAGVCGLDDVDAGFEGFEEGFDPELMNFSICADFSGRSCRVFLSNM